MNEKNLDEYWWTMLEGQFCSRKPTILNKPNYFWQEECSNISQNYTKRFLNIKSVCSRRNLISKMYTLVRLYAYIWRCVKYIKSTKIPNVHPNLFLNIEVVKIIQINHLKTPKIIKIAFTWWVEIIVWWSPYL